MTGAMALQTNILAWLTPIAVILVMALGAMAMANRMSWGWCIGAILGIAIAFGAPQIVSWVRGMFESDRHECAQRRFNGGSPVRGRDAATDAVGCHVFSVAVQHGVHHGGVSVDQKPADPSAVCAHTCAVRAAVRSRRTVF